MRVLRSFQIIGARLELQCSLVRSLKNIKWGKESVTVITDMPSAEDFESAGLDYLQIAWGIISQLSADYAESGELHKYFEDEAGELVNPEDVPKEYWKSCQRQLSVSLSLIQQGIEFLLKARIAAISPFLLLSGYPKSLPKSASIRNHSFSDFRTLDASDLISIYNLFCTQELPEEFIKLFDELRKLRNTIMHSVKTSLSFTEKQIYTYILEAHSLLMPNTSWICSRLEYLERQPIARMQGYMGSRSSVYWEIINTLCLFSPDEHSRYYGLREATRYICPSCNEEYWFDETDENAEIAQLETDSPNETKLFCVLCGETFEVMRKPCMYPECKSTVIFEGRCGPICLLCNSEQ